MKTPESIVGAVACLALCFWVGSGVRAHAEAREVSIAEVMREFCAVVAANEGHYLKLVEACFPDASQDADSKKSCRAVVNSVTKVMNEFFSFRESLQVKATYFVPYDWTPPATFVERWKCKILALEPRCPLR